MVLVEWRDELVLGVDQIDEHHKKLVDIMNQCYQALLQNRQNEQLADVVNELQHYTEYHFDAEQKLMAESRYAGAAAHVAEHEDFKASLQSFRKGVEAREELVAVDLLLYLTDWLVEHIKKSDRDFIEFVRGKQNI